MSFDRLFRSLERRKRSMLEDVTAWTPEALARHPAPGAWCALDVLDHIAKSELGIAETMRGNFAAPRTITPREKLRGLAMCAFFYAPTRVTIPGAANAILPVTPPDLSTVVAAWDRARGHLYRVIARMPETARSSGVFRHPVAGWMTPATTLRFLDAHIVHHAYQLARIRRAVR